jgi:hypothetical protein
LIKNVNKFGCIDINDYICIIKTKNNDMIKILVAVIIEGFALFSVTEVMFYLIRKVKKYY